MRYLNSAGLLRFHGKMMKRLNGKVIGHQMKENEEFCMAVNAAGDLVFPDVPLQLGIPAEQDRFGDGEITSDTVAQTKFMKKGSAFFLCVDAASITAVFRKGVSNR